MRQSEVVCSRLSCFVHSPVTVVCLNRIGSLLIIVLSLYYEQFKKLLQMGLFLRDMAENIGNRKLRELTDFEWRRNLRFYFHDHEHSMYHLPNFTIN